MELTLKVPSQVAQKIKALAELSGQTGTEITEILSGKIDDILAEEIVQAMNEKLSSLGIQNMSLSVAHQVEEHTYIPNGQSRPFIASAAELSGSNIEIDDVDEEWESSMGSALDEDDFSMGDGLAEEGLEEDTPLPDNELILPGEDNKEEEMAVLTKEGEETSYEDDIMADAQAMAEDDGFDGGGYTEPVGDMGSGRPTNVSLVGDDAPVDESGQGGPDVLPVDLGINSVLDNKGAVDFFAAAMSGQTGDKSKRNSHVKRPRPNRY